jgi:hypothetical protein
MKKLVILIVFLSVNGFAQTPDFLWAAGAGGNSWELARCVTTDDDGNIFVAGYFESPKITFRDITLKNVDIGGYTVDIFIVKFDPLGNVLWAKRYGGSNNDAAVSISADHSGNLLITGVFVGYSITFDTINLTKQFPGEGLFIAKLNASGNAVWAYCDSNSESSGYCAIFDEYSNNYITGFFRGTMTFGDIILQSDSQAMFIVKYDTSGNVVWAQKAEGIESDGFYAAADLTGNLIINGSFIGDTLAIGSVRLINAGGKDIFVAKFDPSGNVIWAKSAGGVSHDWGRGVAADNLGNVFITGSFYGPDIAFDTINISGNGDIFIAKYDRSGNVLWVNIVHGNLGAEATAIASDSQGNVLIAGNTWSQLINFNNNFFLNPDFHQSMIIAEYDSTGYFLWAKIVIGGNCGIGALSICTDAFNDPIISGFYHSTSLTFGNTTLINANPSTSTSDIFISKIDVLSDISEVSNIPESIRIYPNPCKGQFSLTSLINMDELKITSIVGQVIYLSKPNSQNMSFYIDEPGIYLVTVKVSHQKITRKLIVN